jgi:hypothetical protein
MTEAEWDRTEQLWTMWPVLTKSRQRDAVRARNRKFRLIACAHCRDAWDLLIDERSRRAVEVAERFADGLAGDRELQSAKTGAWWAYCEEAKRRNKDLRPGLAAHAAGFVAHKDAKEAAGKAASAIGWVRVDAADPNAIWKTCDLIREVFGNPFRPVVIVPAWRTPDVLALAQAAYDSRSLPSGRLESARLGVLADALEDAGCAEQAILSHLRTPTPHVRGCWAVDLLTGRE